MWLTVSICYQLVRGKDGGVGGGGHAQQVHAEQQFGDVLVQMSRFAASTKEVLSVCLSINGDNGPRRSCFGDVLGLRGTSSRGF